MLARTKTAQWAPCTLGVRGGFGQHVSGPVDDTAPTRRTPQHALGGGDHPAAPPLMTSDGGRVPRPGPVLGGHRVHRGERASQEQVVQRHLVQALFAPGAEQGLDRPADPRARRPAQRGLRAERIAEGGINIMD